MIYDGVLKFSREDKSRIVDAGGDASGFLKAVAVPYLALIAVHAYLTLMSLQRHRSDPCQLQIRGFQRLAIFDVLFWEPSW